ncbi:MAG: pilus assembly protein [Methylovulum sp.]|uniref:pilus assembly PilX family protein n=1 Tax=Methylovulum sp. TaxID=1916980 RepID=UPI00260870E9|nr:pilus assembly protein [Methylovulum sp.]MDD2724764.1 pilus assembly protein [Methylovulum sp.]MDD5124372.1 pilus assembly protein [Methylovulum sp.]
MYQRIKYQSGAVLVISLIMLLLLTLIGITGTLTSSLEERMAGNMRDESLAFQAAESALAAAEATLAPPTPLPTFADDGTGGFYSQASTIPTTSALMTDTFWTGQPVHTSSVTGLGVATPSYIIQNLGPVPCLTPPCPAIPIYRITVRATGQSASTVVILQSVHQP